MTEFDLYAFADLLYNGGQELPPVNDRPREWAKAVNDLICKRLDLPKGPFWGPNFKEQQKNPVYKIGGPGSVGLQSIYGIQNLVELRNEIRSRGIELFCWPFDGWDLPSSGHVLVEIYPKLFKNKTKRAGYWIGLIQTISRWNQEMNYSGHRWKDG